MFGAKVIAQEMFLWFLYFRLQTFLTTHNIVYMGITYFPFWIPANAIVEAGLYPEMDFSFCFFFYFFYF